MKAIRKILVAVKNPDARRQPGVDKAIRIAKTLGASIELFMRSRRRCSWKCSRSAGHRSPSSARVARSAQQRLDLLIARARKVGVRNRRRRMGLSAARGHRAIRARARRSHHRRVPRRQAARLVDAPHRLGAAACQPRARADHEIHKPWRRTCSPPSIRRTRTPSPRASTNASFPRPHSLRRRCGARCT